MSRFVSLLRLAATLGAFYAAAVCLAMGLLVAGFRLGVFAGIDILFYRGLIIIAVAAVLSFAILALGLRRLRSSLGMRDAFAATISSACMSLSFLVVVPVTADRSISVFLLAEMAAQNDAITPAEASRMFKSVYVDDYKQIDRRLNEQSLSGNVLKEGETFRITQRGRFVVATSQFIAKLFDSRTGIADPRVVAAHDSLAARP